MSVPRILHRLFASATAPDVTTTNPAAPGVTAPAPQAAGNPAAPLPTPRGPRLNRNALTIVAAASFMGVVAVVVFVQPTPQAPPPGDVAPPVAPGTYLDQPTRGTGRAPVSAVPTGPNPATAPVGAATPPNGVPAVPNPSGSRQGADAAYGSASQVAAAGYQATGYPNTQVGVGGSTVVPNPSAAEDAYAAEVRARNEQQAGAEAGTAGGAVGRPRPLTRQQLRQLAFRRALVASAVGGPERTTEDGASRGGVPVVAAGYDGAGATLGDAPGYAPAGTPGANEPAAGSRSAQFLTGAAQRGRTVQALTLDPAPGPYTVQAGTVIPAILMTEINSDLPGECLAQITRDVYDSRSQRIPLIPRGAKLLCKYDDQLGAGQSRLLVAWTRVLLPDGRSVQLPGLPATDQVGARGVADQVDRHTRKAFGTAAALSLLSAGVQLSQPRNGSVLAAPTTGQIVAGSLGQELNTLGVEMLRRDMTNQQTIRIRQGTQFNVFLNTDLTFPGPYAGLEPAPAPAGSARTAAYRGFARQ